MSVLPSYRNQSIGLLCKSIDWFLYEENTGIKWVKKQFRDFLNTNIIQKSISTRQLKTATQNVNVGYKLSKKMANYELY